LRKGKQVTQPTAGGHELAHACAGKGKTHGDFEIAEHPGGERREVDFTQESHAASAQGRDALDEAPIDFPDARVDGKKHEHGHQHESDGNFGGETDTQPDHEQRRQDHSRNRVQEHHHRL
jgi:hypothetical protein